MFRFLITFKAFLIIILIFPAKLQAQVTIPLTQWEGSRLIRSGISSIIKPEMERFALDCIEKGTHSQSVVKARKLHILVI